MKKLKLNKSIAQDSALTREQLKGIMGGSGSGGSYTLGCSGKSKGDSCYYKNTSGVVMPGTCDNKGWAGALICWGG